MHIQSKAKPSFEPIAVVGVSCRFPGAPDLDAFAELLARGGDAVTEIPADRWTRDSYEHSDPKQPGKTYTSAAGVIEEVDRFDAAFFGISPREAIQMDPQQRLLLELTHEAIEDAGIPGRRLAGSRTGVYVGGSASDYLALRLGDPAVADAYFMTGATLSTLSNRISYIFDLKGPSFTVDTACSSSLVALHLACSAMRRGEIEFAVVGGVNLLLAPQSFVGFSRAMMLSPRGRCHAFADGADGYVRSEGGGVVLLKPLQAAIADGDVIRAVIEGTGVNSDGRTAGLSLPSGTAQANLLRDIYGQSRVDPNDLVYVEAHGTGTAVGDPIEAKAIGEVLGKARHAVLPIGSVKTNIGHLEAGSGMAGLLKAILVLRDGMIPASLHSQVLNPAIDFEALNLIVAREQLPVTVTGARRAAAVNSFGFGGTNAHAVLSAAPDLLPVPCADAAEELPPLLLSARSSEALTELATSWANRLSDLDGGQAAPLLRAAARGREQHTHRLVATSQVAQGLVKALRAHVEKHDSADLATGVANAGSSIAFIYSGNGSQWVGMGADAMQDKVFRRAIEEVDAELQPVLGWSVVDRLSSADAAMMRRTDVAQPLLFAVQHACTSALSAFGVNATAHLGHSVGEVAAALASGALSLQDAVQVIAIRSSAQQRTANRGGMAVMAVSADDVVPLLDIVPEVEVAAVNSSASITVAGPKPALERLERLAARRRIHFALLDLDYAFHSAAMDPIRDSLLRDLDSIEPRRTADPFYSTVFGRAHDGTGLDADYWWRNVRAPVRFADAVSAVVADGCRILLEVGPNPVLQSYLRDGLRRSEVQGKVLTTLSRRKPDGAPFGRIVAQVHVAGHDISGGPLFGGHASLDRLPHYPWQRERYWYTPTDEATDTISARREHPLLGFRRGDEPSVWFNTLDTTKQPWLADHAVDGASVLPATAMVEMALAAARARHPDVSALDILDLEITRPLLLERETGRETRFTVVGERGVFELASRARLSGEAWTVHATGRLGAGSTAPLPEFGSLDASHDGLRLSAETLYALTTKLGLNYGAAFQTVSQVVTTPGGDGLVRLVPDTAKRIGEGYLTDPARFDGALQGLVAIAADRVTDDVALLPWRIGRVRLSTVTGASVTEARLHVTRVGPRSLAAEIALLDAAGTVVAMMTDCWFTRVGSAAEDDLFEQSFHTVMVPKPLTVSDAAQGILPRLVETEDAGEDEAALLTEAYIAAVAYSAVAALTEVETVFRPGTMVAAGHLHPDARGLFEAVLLWLERDGLARCEAGMWSLIAVQDLPPAAEIWRSILAGAPTAVAEAALVGVMAQALPALFVQGCSAAPNGLAPLTHHMQVASPTAHASVDQLTDALRQVAESWPANRPLRILELAAFDGAVTARWVETLRRSGVSCEFVASVSPGHDMAVAAASAPLPGSRIVDWALGDQVPATLASGSFDVVIGLFALTRGRVAGEALMQVQELMAPNALLLLAEPRPSRTWDLRFGMDKGWWGDGAASGLRDGREWLARLTSAGFGEGSSTSVGGAVWSAQILSAQSQRAAIAPSSTVAANAPLLIIAEAGDTLGMALAETMVAQGRHSLTVAPAGAAELFRDAPPRDGDIVFISPKSERLIEGIAANGAALGAWAAALSNTTGLRLWVVGCARNEGQPDVAALRGMTRVLANEAPNLKPYFIRVDPELSPELAAGLITAELEASGAETEVAVSLNERMVPRVRRGPWPIGLRSDHTPAKLIVGRPGLLDTLQWDVLAPALPGRNQVGIEVMASGLNFRDVMWALGLLPDEALMDGLAGATLGLECAGTVTAIGAGVSSVKVGDRVMAIAPACLATHVIAPDQSVVRLPPGIEFTAGATVPVAFLTVCYALGTLANIQPGERVLIHGGAGGVGLAAIQYARHRGAEVFASAGSPAKRTMLRLLGVDHVLDSRSLAFADEVMAATGNQGIDVVLNSLAGEAMERSVGVLRPFGRFLELGKRDLYGNTPLGLRALRHNVSYFAIDADQLPMQRPNVARRVFDEIASLMERGVLRPLPHRLFRFGQATDAFRLMQSAGHIGKIVLVPEPEGVPLEADTSAWAPDAKGTYLVTGGLAGFGLETARWLVDQGVRSVALLGRRGAETPGAAEAIAGFTAQGVIARAFACDVSDAVALAGVLDVVRGSMLPLKGVVHAAMVLDDALMPQLDVDRFIHVLQPKLAAALALDQLTRSDQLDLFLLFSSITTTLGNPGQANYVAANAGLEALAVRRQAEGLPAMSIGWGPIADVGYLSREQAVSDALAARMGGSHMQSRQALSLLPALLGSGSAHVDLGRVRWGAMRQHLPHLVSPQFDEVASGHVAEAGQIDLKKMLAETSPDEARTIVGDILAEEVAAITKSTSHQIDLTRSLTDLGMDSLMAVELRMSLERRFGANLPLLSLADGSSIGSIAVRIVKHLMAAAPTGSKEAATAMLSKYEDMSDEDERPDVETDLQSMAIPPERLSHGRE